MQVPSVVTIGGQNKAELRAALEARGVLLNALALALFEHAGFSTLPRREEIAIACVSVAELGFADGAQYLQIVQAANERHLVECPIELGPHLRLAYPEQPEDAIGFAATKHQAPPGALTVASKLLDEDESTPAGFYLRRIQDVLWLRGYTSWPGHPWNAEDVFVFARQG